MVRLSVVAPAVEAKSGRFSWVRCMDVAMVVSNGGDERPGGISF